MLRASTRRDAFNHTGTAQLAQTNQGNRAGSPEFKLSRQFPVH
jgi:hypothetical protein